MDDDEEGDEEDGDGEEESGKGEGKGAARAIEEFLPRGAAPHAGAARAPLAGPRAAPGPRAVLPAGMLSAQDALPHMPPGITIRVQSGKAWYMT